MNLIGKILWWDEKYRRGAIESSDGSEFFFDGSSIKLSRITRKSAGKIVSFLPNKRIKTCLVAKEVQIVASKDLKGKQERLVRALKDLAA